MDYLDRESKIKVAVFLINRQFIRSWIDSGLLKRMADSGHFEIAVFAQDDIFGKLPQSPDFQTCNLGTIQVSKYSRHTVAMGLVTMSSRSETFRYKLERQFLPDTRFFPAKMGFVAAYKLFVHNAKQLVGNTFHNRMTALYFMKPFRFLLRRYLKRLNEIPTLPPEIRNGNFDWLIIPAASGIGVTTDFLVGARALGIHSLIAIDNWDHLTGKSIYPTKPNFFTVMGTRDIEHAVTIHGFDPKTILPFGLPRFDIYRTMKRPFSNNRTSTKKRILYCGFSLPHSEKRVVDQMASYFEGKFGIGAVEICYRPHPGPLPRYDTYELANPRVIVTDHGNIGRTAMPAMDDEFIDALMSADVVVGAPTTLLLEAMLVGKPCVLDLTIDDYHRTTAGISARRHTHILDMTAVSGIPRGETIPELIKTVDLMLESNLETMDYDISHLYNVNDPPYEEQLESFLIANTKTS